MHSERRNLESSITTSRRSKLLYSRDEVIFCDPVSEDLQCQICLGPAIEAVVTEECGHLFCRECIVMAMERKKECPVDRLPLTFSELRKDVRTQRKIMSLTTSCINKRSGCMWQGEFSDLDKHVEKCEFAMVKCPFAQHGCDASLTRKTMAEHIASSTPQHVLQLCHALNKLQEENVALQQEMELLHREELRFVWAIPSFEQKKGPLYSRKFFAKGYLWYVGVDFEGPDQHAGVYLFAEGHTKRVDFKLILFNQDPSKDKVHMVNDWSHEYKGKGWGPLKFIDRATIASTGFLVNGCVRIGTDIEGEPFD